MNERQLNECGMEWPMPRIEPCKLLRCSFSDDVDDVDAVMVKRRCDGVHVFLEFKNKIDFKCTNIHLAVGGDAAGAVDGRTPMDDCTFSLTLWL